MLLILFLLSSELFVVLMIVLILSVVMLMICVLSVVEWICSMMILWNVGDCLSVVCFGVVCLV